MIRVLARYVLGSGLLLGMLPRPAAADGFLPHAVCYLWDASLLAVHALTDALIGLSTHSPEQVAAAHAQPVDYISVGPVWETPTKEGRRATGLELIEHAAREATLPWFAIGGIDPSNVAQVVAAGARRICVVRAIRDAFDPAAAARALMEPIDAAVEADAA